jgi:hypothetical protein
MENRLDEIMQLASALGIEVTEEDFSTDLDIIADIFEDTFWDEMNQTNNYEDAYDAASVILGEQLDELSYIESCLQNDGWDDSDEYDEFRELVLREVSERADVPLDEDSTEQNSEAGEDFESDAFNEEE